MLRKIDARWCFKFSVDFFLVGLNKKKTDKLYDTVHIRDQIVQRQN